MWGAEAALQALSAVGPLYLLVITPRKGMQGAEAALQGLAAV